LLDVLTRFGLLVNPFFFILSLLMMLMFSSLFKESELLLKNLVVEVLTPEGWWFGHLFFQRSPSHPKDNQTDTHSKLCAAQD
jgi:hypothetical protein